MNWDRIQGNWKQFKGVVKEQWGELTDDELEVIAGHKDQLAGKLQEHYGLSREEAERQVSDWQQQQQFGDTLHEESPLHRPQADSSTGISTDGQHQH